MLKAILLLPSEFVVGIFVKLCQLGCLGRFLCQIAVLGCFGWCVCQSAVLRCFGWCVCQSAVLRCFGWCACRYPSGLVYFSWLYAVIHDRGACFDRCFLHVPGCKHEVWSCISRLSAKEEALFRRSTWNDSKQGAGNGEQAFIETALEICRNINQSIYFKSLAPVNWRYLKQSEVYLSFKVMIVTVSE